MRSGHFRRNGNFYSRLPVLPPDSAKAAGLRHASDDVPGIRRVRARKAFRYIAPDGRPLREAGALARIRALAVPPAWADVWICPRDDGHLQATGRDARGRKQYRHHRRWSEVRGQTKYGRMLAFAHALPRIRHRVRLAGRRGRRFHEQGFPHLGGLPRNPLRAELAQPDLRLTARSLLKPGRSHPQSSTRGATPWN